MIATFAQFYFYHSRLIAVFYSNYIGKLLLKGTCWRNGES